MRAAPPKEFETGALIDFLADAWGLPVEAVHYAAVGGGSYHWIVNDADGQCGFATADDLDLKPWLGETRESVFEGLSRSFGTAVALRNDGLAFVTAPIPTSSGETLRRFGSHCTVALFPFVAGQAGTFGQYETAERAALLAMLAELHQATPAVASVGAKDGPRRARSPPAGSCAAGAEPDVDGGTPLRARAELTRPARGLPG